MNHTPTPWGVQLRNAGAAVVSPDPKDPENAMKAIIICSGLGGHRGNAHYIVRCVNAHDELVAIANALSLLTDEGDDALRGAYIDKQGAIRAKGSTLELIERARAALAKVQG